MKKYVTVRSALCNFVLVFSVVSFTILFYIAKTIFVRIVYL